MIFRWNFNASWIAPNRSDINGSDLVHDFSHIWAFLLYYRATHVGRRYAHSRCYNYRCCFTITATATVAVAAVAAATAAATAGRWGNLIHASRWWHWQWLWYWHIQHCINSNCIVPVCATSCTSRRHATFCHQIIGRLNGRPFFMVCIGGLFDDKRMLEESATGLQELHALIALPEAIKLHESAI